MAHSSPAKYGEVNALIAKFSRSGGGQNERSQKAPSNTKTRSRKNRAVIARERG